ncbi:MAG: Ig-like domain-containing protein [Alphaproteobacteria bacterium]
MAFGSNGTVSLSDLDGVNGFVLNGIDRRDGSGISVSSAGDVNGDGLDDLIIGARDANPNGNSSAGESYVVFGRRAQAANADPDARDDAVTTNEDTALAGTVFADNGNGADTDGDGDTLTVTEVNGQAADVGTEITLTSGALLTLNSDGSFDYDPNGQFETLSAGDTATDSFTYTVEDGQGGSDTATVSVTVSGVDAVPPPSRPNWPSPPTMA